MSLRNHAPASPGTPATFQVSSESQRPPNSAEGALEKKEAFPRFQFLKNPVIHAICLIYGAIIVFQRGLTSKWNVINRDERHGRALLLEAGGGLSLWRHISGLGLKGTISVL